MSDIIEEAVGEITVKDSTGAGIASASANFQRLYGVVKNNWWGIQNLGRAFAAVGGVIAAGLSEATKATIDFDQGLAQAQRTGQLTTAQTNELGEALRKMALQKPISVDQLTQIATAAGQLGINGVKNIESFTGTIADLVNTTDLTVTSAEQLAKLAGPLGIAGDEWSRLGSTILTMGIHTAATENEIVKVAQQLAGVGASAGISTPQIIGMSAVIASIGSQSSSAATGISRLIGQIATAASGTTKKANDQFATFAHIAGYDSPAAIKKFAASFNEDAAPAIGKFIDGIGKMRGEYTKQTQVLNDLGIKETREIRAITTIGSAQEQTTNKYLHWTTALQASENAWVKNQALTSQANKLYGTTANQLKILENTVHDIAISFGGDLAKSVGMVLKPIADVLYGIDQLPAGVKTVIDVFGALSAALFLGGSAAASLAQRYVLVKGSLFELGGVTAGAAAQAKTLQYAYNQQAIAAGEAADATSISVGRMSKAEKEALVTKQASIDADKIAEAQQAGLNAATNARTASSEAAAAATEQQTAASQAAAAADEAEAEAAAIVAKGDEEAATAAEANAEAMRAAALAAEELASTQAALAAELDEIAVGFELDAVAAGKDAEATIAAGVAAEEASGFMYMLGTALDAATGPFAAIFIGITAVTGALAIFGSHQRDSLDASEQQAQANDQLAQAINQSGSATGAAVVAYYTNNDAFLKLANSTEAYGIQLLQLLNIITGVTSGAAATAQLSTLKAAAEAGSSSARDTYNQIAQTINVQRASVIQSNEMVKAKRAEAGASKGAGSAADGQTAAEKRLASGTDGAAASSHKETQALEKEKAAHDQINQAVLDYPQALLAVQQAQESLTAAQKAYNDALAEGNTRAKDIKNAEDALKSDRLAEKEAVDAVAEAEVNLQRARQNEVDAAAAAADQLTSDQNRLADDQQSIIAAQQKLQEDQASNGMLDLTKAVNALNDAYAKLHDATESVSDAQYNLNYLLAEGASARDIADAQQQLTEAQNGQADAATGVTDAQNDLNTAQQASGAQQLAQDERDLSDAELQVASDQRQLTQDTYGLQDARKALEQNKGVLDAEQALQDAQNNLDKTQQQLKDDAIALRDARKESGADAEKEAEQGLTGALLDLANAHVKVTQDLAEMEGKQFGAGKQAAALSAELTKLGENAAGPVAANIKKFQDALANRTTDIKVPTASSDSGGGGGGGGLGDIPGAGSDANKLQKVPAAIPLLPDPKGWLQKAWDAWSKFDVRIVDDVGQWGKDAWDSWSKWDNKIFGSIYDGMGAAILWMHKELFKLWDDVSGASQQAWKDISNLASSTWTDVTEAGEQAWTDISGAADDAWKDITGVFSDIGGAGSAAASAIEGGFQSAWSWITSTWSGIGDDISKPITSAAKAVSKEASDLLDDFKKPWTWVKSSWKDITNNIENPVQDAVKYISTHFDNIEDDFKKPWQWVKDSWSDIKDHLESPIDNAATHIENEMTHLVTFFSNVPGKISKAARGMFDGIWEAFRAAINLLISGWDKLHFHIPGFKVFGIGYSGFDVGAGYIAPLAEGGVVTKPTLALMGEGGQNEVVMPLSSFGAMFEPVTHLALQMQATNSALTSLLSGGAGTGQTHEGDTFNITQADADPMQIAEQIIFKKKVQLR